jgi:hypothetical protein
MTINPPLAGVGVAGAVQPVASPAGVAAPASAPFGADVDLEFQTLLAFQRRQAAELLVKLYDYLDKNVAIHSELANVIPVLRQAVELYRTGSYDAALAQAFAVFRFIMLLRATKPGVPEL